MITISELRKVYRQGKREIVALDGVSLSVPKGAVHGIIGHSGAGKSTLVAVAATTLFPSSGSVHVLGGGPPVGGDHRQLDPVGP